MSQVRVKGYDEPPFAHFMKMVGACVQNQIGAFPHIMLTQHFQKCSGSIFPWTFWSWYAQKNFGTFFTKIGTLSNPWFSGDEASRYFAVPHSGFIYFILEYSWRSTFMFRSSSMCQQFYEWSWLGVILFCIGGGEHRFRRWNPAIKNLPYQRDQWRFFDRSPELICSSGKLEVCRRPHFPWMFLFELLRCGVCIICMDDPSNNSSLLSFVFPHFSSEAITDSRPPRLVVDSTVCGTNGNCIVNEHQCMPSAKDVLRTFPLRNIQHKLSAFGLYRCKSCTQAGCHQRESSWSSWFQPPQCNLLLQSRSLRSHFLSPLVGTPWIFLGTFLASGDFCACTFSVWGLFYATSAERRASTYSCIRMQFDAGFWSAHQLAESGFTLCHWLDWLAFQLQYWCSLLARAQRIQTVGFDFSNAISLPHSQEIFGKHFEPSTLDHSDFSADAIQFALPFSWSSSTSQYTILSGSGLLAHSSILSFRYIAFFFAPCRYSYPSG